LALHREVLRGVLGRRGRRVTLQLVVLYSLLAAFSAHDLYNQTIPRWLCGSAALGLILAHWQLGIAWWWTSAILAVTAFTLAGLPMGDRAAIFLSCGLLAPGTAAALVALAFGAGFAYVSVVGRYRSMIGFPFFPAVAVCGIVLTQVLARWN
jgi:hypothetical protein